MNDLISRQAMLDGIDKLIKIHFDRTVVLYKARQVAENLPSVQPETNCSEIPNNCPAADVVSVVRCKDCKFRENDDFCTGRGFPYQLVPDDGFCDKGRKERR